MRILLLTGAFGLLSSSLASGQSVVHYWDFSSTTDVVGGAATSAVGTVDLTVHPTYGEAYAGSGATLNTVIGGTGNGSGFLEAAIAGLDLDFGTDSFSFSYWVWDDFASDMDVRGARVFDCLSGTTTGLQLGTNGTNDWNFRVDDDMGAVTIFNNVSPFMAPADQWVHVVGVVDRPMSEIRAYVNGALTASIPFNNSSNNAPVIGNVFPTQDLQIGAINGGSNTGQAQTQGLDDLAFYEGVISGADAAALAAGTKTPLSFQTGTIVVEATGTIVQANASASSPFNGIMVGDPVLVHLEVIYPGTDLAPGQLTNYTVDLANSFVTIGAFTDTLAGGALGIQNDFPVADGIRMPNSPMTGGGGLALEVGESSGTLFSSTDITMQLGSWPSTTWSSFNFGIFGGGSFIEFSNPDVTIKEVPIGTNYCTATVNSTGVAANMTVSGSADIADNDFTITANNLPLNQFGILFTSMTQGFDPGVGGTSNGNLCVGGVIGRFPIILSSGATGSFSVTTDLNAFPQGVGGVPVTSGQTWNFQGWCRDQVGLGSNLTDGISVTFN